MTLSTASTPQRTEDSGDCKWLVDHGAVRFGPMTDLADVVCPTCFETFSIPAPSVAEVPCEVDYDCEVCCRPMLVAFFEDAGEVVAEARGLGD
ncbi:MAG: CPXCG motif-containing cysteine-rich protein [Verrucomicrobiota bacterium]